MFWIRPCFASTYPQIAPCRMLLFVLAFKVVTGVWKGFTLFNLISENFLIPLFGQFWGRSGCFHLGFMIYTLFLRHVCSGGGFFITFLCSDCFVLAWDKIGSFEGPRAYVQNIGRSLSLRNAVETIVHPVLWFLQISVYWSWLWSRASLFSLLPTLASMTIFNSC